MGAKNIDELFQSGLAQKESEVSSDSWSKMEMLLEHQQPAKSKKVIWYVAASVAVLMTLSFTYFILGSQQELEGYQPVITANLKAKPVELPTMTLASVQIQSIPKVAVPQMNMEAPSPKQEKVITPETIEVPVEMLAQVAPEIESETTENSELQIEEKQIQSPIKVVYKKSPESSIELADIKKEKKSFKELLNQAREFDTSDVWADIRDAKEKVLENPFGIQKTQRQKLK